MSKKFILLALLCFASPYISQARDANEKSYHGAHSGEYDYLVYAVTWQPTFCLLYPDSQSCKSYRANFYTHGIWPYFKSNAESKNRHPSYCVSSPGCIKSSACSLSKDSYLSLITNKDFRKLVPPQPKDLMLHEWKKHGTCYGKNQTEYFSSFYTLRDVVVYDNKFIQSVQKTVPFNEMKNWFPKNTRFRCEEKHGKQYLFEVFYLLNRQGQPYYDDQELQIGKECTATEIVIPG